MRDTQVFVFVLNEENEFGSSVENRRISCFLTQEKLEQNREREAYKPNCRFVEFTVTSNLNTAFHTYYALVNKTTAYIHIKDAIREDDNHKLYVIADKLFAKAIAHQFNLKIVKVNIV